ncbi:MAG TPA: hypothetical protein VEF34_19665 [Syntrophobacteraceae bacterium]|nr:hypothetical protein [Syntrophobacteraceae bacterium]
MEEHKSRDVSLYHGQTKHHFNRFSRSPGYMDWENQPDPFRAFSGIEHADLLLLEKDPEAGHLDLYKYD